MIDKFINPLTLLVGPALVSYLIYKSTLHVDDGGYHLPAWNIVVSVSFGRLSRKGPN
jgi:hypothetical protein